jgi:hypothetical protein
MLGLYFARKNYTAFKDRILQRPAVRRALDDEQIKV